MRRLLTALLVFVLGCTGCSLVTGDASDDEPKALATLLARGLSRHSLAHVPLTRDSAVEKYAQLVAPLDGERVKVAVGRLTEADNSVKATLRWNWDLSGRPWRYATSVRLVDAGNRWEVDWAPAALEPTLGTGDRLELRTVPTSRGRILGQGGVALVRDRPVLRYGIDKTTVAPTRVVASARRVAEALHINAKTYVARVTAAGPKAFVEGLVVRVDDARRIVGAAYADIPGAVALEDEMPLPPTREFAVPLIGRVGPATADVIAKSGGQVVVGDVVGLSGLQARYEEQLSGSPGMEVLAVGTDKRRRTLFQDTPQRGRDLPTTLDPALQTKAERVLAAVGENGPRSALVAIRTSDGSILAAANGPGNGGLNVATAGQYAPGSTFKVVTALALLRAGVKPQDTVTCPNTVDVDGRSFKNYDDYPSSRTGRISLRTAFANSCNTAMIGAGHRLEGNDLSDAAAALGLGHDYDLGFPAYFGQVPPPSGETERAADLIGQGKVLASPMTMAAVAASVRSGRTVVPTLLPDHRVDPVPPASPLTAAESQTLRALMRAVVTDGSGRFLADLPGDVGAKTGTAEYGKPAPNGTLRTHAWMIATRGDLAVAVFVETGQSGSATAGPYLEAFLR